MTDPHTKVVTLLQPAARFAIQVLSAGRWRIRRSDAGEPFYCVVLEGGCRLALDGNEPVVLQTGDFVLIPAAFGFAMSSLESSADASNSLPVAIGERLFRIGTQEGPTDLRILVGHCSFGSPDAAMLVSLLPELIHVRGEPRLATLVQLVGDEIRDQRPAAARARGDALASVGSAAHRGLSVDRQDDSIAGSGAWTGRHSLGRRDPSDARRADASS